MGIQVWNQSQVIKKRIRKCKTINISIDVKQNKITLWESLELNKIYGLRYEIETWFNGTVISGSIVVSTFQI